MTVASLHPAVGPTTPLQFHRASVYTPWALVVEFFPFLHTSYAQESHSFFSSPFHGGGGCFSTNGRIGRIGG